MSDRSRDVSTALTEVRTVHSRALAALDRLDGEWAGERIPDPDYPKYDGYQGPGMNRQEYADWHAGYVESMINMADQDHDEIRAALEKVVELLDPWKKHGRRKR